MEFLARMSMRSTLFRWCLNLAVLAGFFGIGVVVTAFTGNWMFGAFVVVMILIALDI